MKKVLGNSAISFMGLGCAMLIVSFIIAIFLGQKTLGETLGIVSFAGLLTACFGAVLGIAYILWHKLSKT